jgi:hypothetical protein
MLKSKTANLCKVTRHIVRLTCAVLFCLEMVHIGWQFINKDTFATVALEEMEKLLLPSFTICPGKGFKAYGYAFTEDQYEANTYQMEEIFTNNTLLDLRNVSKYSIKTIRSQYHGQCYTIQKLEEVTTSADYSCKLMFKKGMDIDFYPHEPYEEEWLLLSVFPYDVIVDKIDVENDQGIGGIDVQVSKEITQKLQGKEHSCRMKPLKGFVFCVRKRLKEELIKRLNCTIPFFKSLQLQDFLPVCTTVSEANNAVNIASLIDKVTIREKKCKLPCTRVNYARNFAEFPEKSLPESDKLFFTLWIYYSSLQIDEKIERYIYGFETVIVAVGGSMGLFLGWSCYSVIVTGITILERKFV